MHRLASLLVAAPLAIAVACAPAGQSGPQVGPMTESRPDRLTAQEIAGFATVGQAVQALRGTWLRQRASSSLAASSQIWVYRDGVRFGGVDLLTSLSTSEFNLIEFVDGRSAFQRWGMGHESGVIMLSSRRR